MQKVQLPHVPAQDNNRWWMMDLFFDRRTLYQCQTRWSDRSWTVTTSALGFCCSAHKPNNFILSSEKTEQEQKQKKQSCSFSKPFITSALLHRTTTTEFLVLCCDFGFESMDELFVGEKMLVEPTSFFVIWQQWITSYILASDLILIPTFYFSFFLFYLFIFPWGSYWPKTRQCI